MFVVAPLTIPTMSFIGILIAKEMATASAVPRRTVASPRRLSLMPPLRKEEKNPGPTLSPSS